MKPIVLAILGGAALLLLFSCDNNKQNEDITQTVNKSGSIETAVQVTHLDSFNDVLVTTHKVWANNRDVITIKYLDTVPTLGTVETSAENADGETKKIQVKKEYEIFITIK